MDHANDVGTLLEVKEYIYREYYSDEDDLNTRMVLKSIMKDITVTIDSILDDMHDKVGLDD